jgi:hypothetical protein
MLLWLRCRLGVVLEAHAYGKLLSTELYGEGRKAAGLFYCVDRQVTEGSVGHRARRPYRRDGSVFLDGEFNYELAALFPGRFRSHTIPMRTNERAGIQAGAAEARGILTGNSIGSTSRGLGP